MRRRVFLLLILILCLVGVMFYLKSNDRDTKWKNPEAWKKLKKDITMEQVEELLGEPGHIVRRSITRWYYQDLPRETHTEPPYGYVDFEQKDPSQPLSKQTEWIVYKWVEPKWSSVEIKKDTR